MVTWTVKGCSHYGLYVVKCYSGSQKVALGMNSGRIQTVRHSTTELDYGHQVSYTLFPRTGYSCKVHCLQVFQCLNTGDPTL
jgi:hypothetical protein